jgi:hypothetical protein
MPSLTCCDTDSYLSIQDIRINFNNQSGLLATFTKQQLYDSTITNGGIRNLTWEEFSGVTLSASGGVSARFPSLGHYSAAPYNQLSGVGAADRTGASRNRASVSPYNRLNRVPKIWNRYTNPRRVLRTFFNRSIQLTSHSLCRELNQRRMEKLRTRHFGR